MTKPNLPAIAPVTQAERILSLDILRGIAVLGILIMNIQSFSMPGSAYINPMAFGDMEGANKWTWILSHIFADRKFMTIFSILFGAGIILFSERIATKGKQPGGLHYRRTFWLLVLGLIHAYFIWYGDILVTYALCGFLVFPFRKMKPKKLLIIASVFFIIAPILSLFTGISIPYMSPEEQQNLLLSWQPGEVLIQEEITAMTGSWSEVLNSNMESATFMHTFLFIFENLWRVTALMLTGMAFYKMGILSAVKSKGFYRKKVIWGFLIGLPLIIFGVYQNFEAGFSMEYSFFIGTIFNYFGSLPMAFAYIGLIMLFSQSAAYEDLKKRFAAVGRMAFTNYILQSVIGTLIFWGMGFSLFGQVERKYHILIVLAVWLLQLIISPIWLKKYRFGPLEWLWRSLTYWKMQPNIKVH